MKVLVALFLVLTLAIAVMGERTIPKAEAATGDLIGSVTFDQPCPSLGVGIAFDGSNLWYSCYGGSPNLYRASPTTGVVDASYSVPVSNIGALSYDATRNAIWAAGDSDAVYRIDLDAGMNVVGTTLAFNTGDICGINDGLAFDARDTTDPNDDVFYYSDDCFTVIIDVYDLSGALVGSVPTCATGGHNSGVAVGGQLLFQADLFNNATCVVDKTTNVLQFTYSTAVAGDPSFHAEDMECDTSTFPVNVMWSVEAYEPRRAHAYEIPADTCGEGGVPPGDVEVNLDVHPGSCPNPIRLGQKGVVPVAILGTATFDVSTIDVSTVELEGVSPLRSLIKDVATPYGGGLSDPPSSRDCTTNLADGYLDLTLKFDSRTLVTALEAAYGPLVNGQVVVVTITGSLTSGENFSGQDVVLIRK